MIRKATTNDLPAMFAISQDSFGTPWSMVSFEIELVKPFSHSYVYIKNEKIVAFLIIWILNDEGEIVNLAVSKAFRGRGIGTELMQNAFKLNKNVKCWNLEVDPENISAYNLYDKSGFKKNRVIKNYYGQGRDALQMTKK